MAGCPPTCLSLCDCVSAHVSHICVSAPLIGPICLALAGCLPARSCGCQVDSLACLIEFTWCARGSAWLRRRPRVEPTPSQRSQSQRSPAMCHTLTRGQASLRQGWLAWAHRLVRLARLLACLLREHHRQCRCSQLRQHRSCGCHQRRRQKQVVRQSSQALGCRRLATLLGPGRMLQTPQARSISTLQLAVTTTVRRP
ncbi:hypothetical protein BC831DRAFT_454744 [Entophlyctis helioformis]|nr:hypothetical protein BC831DRAFT_454744 [Entophlyctis helioformis]